MGFGDLSFVFVYLFWFVFGQKAHSMNVQFPKWKIRISEKPEGRASPQSGDKDSHLYFLLLNLSGYLLLNLLSFFPVDL